MGRFLLRRALTSLLVALGIVFFVTLILDLIPGDPVLIILGQNATAEQVAALRHELGLDRPLVVRYVDYIGRALTGDLGRSIMTKRSVAAEVADAWPNTLLLASAAITLAVVFGIGLGAVSALRPNGWLDLLVRLLALLGLSMPIFWIGLVFIYIFGFYLRLLPIGGSGTPQHLVLPAVTLALPSVALVARMTRSSLLEVLGEDYVRTARAKGLAEPVVLLGHALRNALIPVVTVIGLQFGQLLGGAILTETVFAWPGLGRLVVLAIFARDYPLLQGIVLIFALSYVVVNLVVDLAYAWLDPRITYA
jgi:peptide/nickel transport system permease protein/oligopeptide transport system permease protein